MQLRDTIHPLLLAAFLFATVAMAAEKSDVQQLAGDLERAKKKAAYAEWLYTEGVLAKSEAEERSLLVVRLKNDLEDARLQAAKRDAGEQEKRFENHEIGKDENDKSQAALAAAVESAHVAAVEWKHAQMETALMNLKRQQELYEKGLAPKSDVRRAEEAVASLKATD